jgi:hypothetical protein
MQQAAARRHGRAIGVVRNVAEQSNRCIKAPVFGAKVRIAETTGGRA